MMRSVIAACWASTRVCLLKHNITLDDDVLVPMRDRIDFLADVRRLAEPGRYPVPIAASIYPQRVHRAGSTISFVTSRQRSYAPFRKSRLRKMIAGGVPSNSIARILQTAALRSDRAA